MSPILDYDLTYESKLCKLIFSLFTPQSYILLMADLFFAKKSVALDQQAQSGAPCRNLGILNLTTFVTHAKCKLSGRLMGLNLRTLSTEMMAMIPILFAKTFKSQLEPSKTDMKSACLVKTYEVNHDGVTLPLGLEIFLVRVQELPCAP